MFSPCHACRCVILQEWSSVWCWIWAAAPRRDTDSQDAARLPAPVGAEVPPLCGAASQTVLLTRLSSSFFLPALADWGYTSRGSQLGEGQVSSVCVFCSGWIRTSSRLLDSARNPNLHELHSWRTGWCCFPSRYTTLGCFFSGQLLHSQPALQGLPSWCAGPERRRIERMVGP